MLLLRPSVRGASQVGTPLASAGTWLSPRWNLGGRQESQCSVGWILTCSHHFKFCPFLPPGAGVRLEEPEALLLPVLAPSPWHCVGPRGPCFVRSQFYHGKEHRQ